MTLYAEETVMPMSQTGGPCVPETGKRLVLDQEAHGEARHKWSGETIWVSGATAGMWALHLKDGAMAGY